MDEFKSLKLPLRVEVDKDFGVVSVRYSDGSLVGFNVYIKSKNDLQGIVDIVNNYPKLAKENKRMREEIALFVGCSNILKKVLAIKEINKKDTYDKGLNYDYVQGYNNALDYIQEIILRPALKEKDGE